MSSHRQQVQNRPPECLRAVPCKRRVAVDLTSQRAGNTGLPVKPVDRCFAIEPSIIFEFPEEGCYSFAKIVY